MFMVKIKRDKCMFRYKYSILNVQKVGFSPLNHKYYIFFLH